MAFDRLPEVLTSKLPLKLSGHLSGDADFRLRRSHLSPKGFHKMRIDGDLRLRDFRASTPDGLSELYIGTAGFRLGTRNSVTVNGVAVDSLLTASLDIDTIAAGIPGIGFSASGISMGVGSRNVSSSSDTTRPASAKRQIHPAVQTDLLWKNNPSQGRTKNITANSSNLLFNDVKTDSFTFYGNGGTVRLGKGSTHHQ